VSTSIRLPSPPWAPYVVRETHRWEVVHRATRSHRVELPSGRTPRTWTSTNASRRVVASHDGISSVSVKPGETRGDVQVPRW
jgi:hypothetical protein